MSDSQTSVGHAWFIVPLCFSTILMGLLNWLPLLRLLLLRTQATIRPHHFTKLCDAHGQPVSAAETVHLRRTAALQGQGDIVSYAIGRRNTARRLFFCPH